jgi:hypothetical protein
MEVSAVSTLHSLLGQAKELIYGKEKAIAYRVKGRLFTGSFGALDFDEGGKLEMPKKDSAGKDVPE